MFQIIPARTWPYRYYAVPACLLLVAGLFSSLYLSYIHYKNYTDLTYSSICAISGSVNCDTVAQSPHSILFSVPLAVWSVLYFALVLIVSASIRPSKSIILWRLLFIIGSVGSSYSVYLAYVSSSDIRSFCLFCMFNYTCIFLFTYYCWLIDRRFMRHPMMSGSKLKLLLKAIIASPIIRAVSLGLLVFSILLPLVFPKYWEYRLSFPASEVTRGITEEGHPWIGANEPDLTIIEFSDYLCFQCYKMHTALRTLVNQYPDRIRLVHIHFPLDHTINPIVREPFHIGTGKMAVLAEFAKSKGFFWEVNDLLYRYARKDEVLDLFKIAAMSGLDADDLARSLQDETYYSSVRKDIAIGLRYKITSTPSFLIDNVIYVGSIPVDFFRLE